ncbi:GNAT family N-acetyltransferase [Prevotella sp. E13-27]|uniref:GNAT family N-acetyltransferase n=1 Tax=Prevotella sp. E13-27 TaxID=2938122 RepID=UPI00200B7746|nr:GNAT family N-acetyltransferase [Prevotella sp. E13-27]MCK8622036.1 GNAT family N-acetyltransferase [Prevotella sp. E13-27]
MSDRFQIIEKPEWVSWDEIHEVVWEAHANNREKGIIMSYPSLSGEEIKKRIENNGKMYVAIDGQNVIGTLALIIKKGNKWYNKGSYGYLCFGAVLPNYSGKGIYRSLYKVAETTAINMGIFVITRDTNEKNARMLKISKQEGYHFVECKAYKDHFNIVRAKWLDGCPYSSWYIKMRFLLSKFKQKTRYKMVPGKGRVKRFGI